MHLGSFENEQQQQRKASKSSGVLGVLRCDESGGVKAKVEVVVGIGRAMYLYVPICTCMYLYIPNYTILYLYVPRLLICTYMHLYVRMNECMNE